VLDVKVRECKMWVGFLNIIKKKGRRTTKKSPFVRVQKSERKREHTHKQSTQNNHPTGSQPTKTTVDLRHVYQTVYNMYIVSLSYYNKFFIRVKLDD